MPIAALVTGIVGLVLSLVPCLGMYAMPLTLLAVILGAIGMKKVPGKGLSTAGMICGIVGTLIATWWIYAYVTTKSAVDAEIEKQHKADLQNGSDLKADPGSDSPDKPAVK